MLEEFQDVIKISNFPKPYHSKYTPYHADFNDFTSKSAMKYGMHHVIVAKVIVLGDICVGKSSLVNRVCYQMFETSYKPTIGLDIHSKRFKIFDSFIDLQIWDTAGQERFRSLALSYYRGAKAVIIVFDFHNLESLKNVEMWLREALSVLHKPYLFLVGSKMDLLEKNSIFNKIEKIAKEKSLLINAEFWSVSSKSEKNVEDLFKRIASLLFDDLIRESEYFVNDKAAIGNPTILKDEIEQINRLKTCRSSTCVK